MKRLLKLRASLRDRFDQKVMPEPMSGCWLWTGGVNEHGYGIIGKGRRSEGVAKAHRVSWELHVGTIPEGGNVLHRCDNPLCVNPAHLFLGSMKDNSIDMVKKNRHRIPDNRGTKAAWAKLNDEQVAEIRRREVPGTHLARKFGVSKSAIYEIWSGRNWASTK